MKPPTPQHQARQALKAALNGQTQSVFTGENEISASATFGGGILLSHEAARLIDQLLTKAHYQGELEKAEKEGGAE